MARKAAARSPRQRKSNTRPGNKALDTKRTLSHQTLERRELLAANLGPQLVAVSANSGENFKLTQSNILTQSPTQLTFRFDGSQQIDPATLSAISIVRSGGDGSFGEANDVKITPGFVGFGESQGVVIARFAETLPDDKYRISIAGFDDTTQGIVGLRNTNGDLFNDPALGNVARPAKNVSFQIELGPQVVAVVPQPVVVDSVTGVRSQLRDQIYVYFNDDKLSNPAAGPVTTTNTPNDPTVVQRQFYKLIYTGKDGGTVENTDDVVITPSSVTYDPALNRAVLTFNGDIATLNPAGGGITNITDRTYRLRIGSSQALPAAPAQIAEGATDAGNTFAGMRNLSTTFNSSNQSLVVSGQIDANKTYTVQWPGFNAPGVRDNRRDAEIVGQPDTTIGVDTYYYNFATIYGVDTTSGNLQNAITEAQKQRTREALSLYSKYLGVQFIETADRGLQIVTGDLRALVRTATTTTGGTASGGAPTSDNPMSEYRISDLDPTRGVLILDAAENWFDGYGLSPDTRPSYFTEALRGVGSLLGIGSTFEQVPGTASGSNPLLYNATLFPLQGGTPPTTFSIEPDFLSSNDLIPGQALHRPEISDVDLYRFNVQSAGTISIETIAQRLDNTSLLNTDLKLWKLNSTTGQYDLVARNDDFYSVDSFIGVEVSPNDNGSTAVYALGITASGNDDYNPNVTGSGSGGLSQGAYQMRVTFQNKNVSTIKDANGSSLDGDANGAQGGDFNFWFRTAKAKEDALAGETRTLFVDKSSINASDIPGNGGLATPYRTISYAFTQAKPGDIVRILPGLGADNLLGTAANNQAYEIGRGGATNAVLADGETFNVPSGVTVMIDAGAVIKLRNAKVSVGSERIDEDRSKAALQILGVPVLVEGTTKLDGSVKFTSYNEERRSGSLISIDTNPLPTTPSPGDWAGIEFRNDVDNSEGRPVWETEGIFLNYVSHADIQYGGGSVSASEPIVNPLQMIESRPTIIYNTIRNSRDAAMSADPNSFLETNFHAPIYQRAATFTSDYDRVGPDLRGNVMTQNSTNGLFVRVRTPAAGVRQPMTVSGRFDDVDVVHAISEVLVLQGQPGGPQLVQNRPDVLSTTLSASATTGNGIANVGSINYRITFVNADGRESLASLPTASVTVAAKQQVTLDNLPTAPSQYVGRRLYRLNPSTGNYEFVTQLDRSSTSIVDTGKTRGGVLSSVAIAAISGERLLPRYDARLSVDPGLVVKLDSARIEADFGADFYAEGTDGKPVVFTSRLDDTYGAGGTFDTNNDGTAGKPVAGTWSGLVFRQGSTASIDHAVISYAGGTSAVAGGFAKFNAVEILQADVRIANSLFSNNAAGSDNNYDIRDSIGFNASATIFVRGAQPVIVNNTIVGGGGAAISINPDALNYVEVSDMGRSTGNVDLQVADNDNQGPLIAGNKLAGNAINGMSIRNESLTTESVWDDTDIVHVVEGRVYAWNHQFYSGLRLKSDPNQSLVVKFKNGAGLFADRYANDVEDAIGGTLQVLGQPGFPVVLTSIADDTVGAGFTPTGLPQNDTDNVNATPVVNWNGLVIAPGANDRNVAYIMENEQAIATASSINAIPSTAQKLGSLAVSEAAADENRRAGFNIRGTLSQNSDIDVYSFFANGGTEVWFDIDQTNFGLDTVVELVDINGNVLAQSNNSDAESSNPSLLVNRMGANFASVTGAVMPLYKSGAKSFETPNALDAGMRLILNGSSNSLNQYYIRVRSNNTANGAPVDPTSSAAGLSKGQYQLAVRLRETDEIAGSTVRLADIRYATTGITVPAAPSSSPLSGEASEELSNTGTDGNDTGTAFDGTEATANFSNGSADPLGSLNSSNRGVLRVSGYLGNQASGFSPALNTVDPILAEADLDVYRVDLLDDNQNPDIIGERRFVSTVFDLDYADQLGRANTSIAVYDSVGRLVLHGRDSNIADDQGRPLAGVDMENLQGGSAGTLDAFIGPVEMQVGTYYVVVSSAQMVPQSLDQFFSATPTNSNVRMLPINSQRNLAEVGFDEYSALKANTSTLFTSGESASRNQGAELAANQPFFDVTSVVPYSLEDIRMFVSVPGTQGGNQSQLLAVDPFTGQVERSIGQWGQPVGDLAMRRDGELFAISLSAQNGNRDNGNTGNFLNISSANGSATSRGDDGLVFQQSNQNFNGVETSDSGQLLVNAIAFQPITNTAGANAIGDVPAINDNERVYVAGTRTNAGRGGELPDELRQNIIYSFVGSNGSATNQGSTNGQLDRNYPANTPLTDTTGPASNKVEFGIVDVGQFPDSNNNYVPGDITGMAQDPTLGASRLWAVTDTGSLYSFSPFGPTRSVDLGVDRVGSPITYNRVLESTFYGVVTRDANHFGTGAPQFSSVSFGPRATEGGRYEQILFATTTDGWLYALKVDAQGRVQPANILSDGRSALQMADVNGNLVNGVTGVAFSIREENPWHINTTDRQNLPEGHGTYAPADQSRIRTAGGTSLYFGFEPTNNVADNTLNDSPNGQLAPGGVHGSTVSRPFSLEGYSSGDKPTLYFDYFMQVQDDDDYLPGIRRQTDSFRVFAVGDDGQWRLLATNDSYRSFVNSDEYDYSALNGGIPVQELFDGTNNWRQARVDLSPLAGNKNVQLRFDFSTAGAMQNPNAFNYLTELQVVPGSELTSGDSFSMFDNNVFNFNTFEFVRGVAFNVPDGSSLLDGQQIAFVRPTGATITLTMRTTAVAANDVAFSRADTADIIAAAIAAKLQTLAPDLSAIANGEQLLAPDATSGSLTPARFGHLALTVPTPTVANDGASLSFTNTTGVTTTISTVTSQRVSFGNGIESVTVTPIVDGLADNVSIRFVDRVADLLPLDVPASATYNATTRAITVTYNSNPLLTPTFNDFDAIVTAIDNLALFSATLTSGVGTTAFTAPLTTPQFSAQEVYFVPGITTADQLAASMAAKINTLDSTLNASAVGPQLILRGAAASTVDNAFVITSQNSGAIATQLLPNGNVPIFYNRSMTSTQVRDAVRTALANGMGEIDTTTGVSLATSAAYPGYGTNRIRLFDKQVFFNTSPLGISTDLPGDEFGSFTSAATGQNNKVEGVYLDDIVVGFAERGEMVLNAPTNNRQFVVDPSYRTFTFTDTQQPEFPNEILVGGYTLEVRQGATYGVPNDYDPIRLELNEQLSLGRGFDTNDRMNGSAVTLISPTGSSLLDGDTFTLSNGTQTLTFEFDSDGSVTPGRVRVPFTPAIPGTLFDRAADDIDVLATSIRDAINSPQARNVLGIRAAGRDGNDTGPMSGNRIDLFGNDIRVNASSGRFLKVDMVAAETPYGTETWKTLPLVDHATGLVTTEATPYSFAKATVTQYVNGNTDTLVATGKIGDTVGTDDANVVLPDLPFNDVDILKIFLRAGDRIDLDLDTLGYALGNGFATPRLELFDEAGTISGIALRDTLTTVTPGNGETAAGAQIVNFAAPASGYYYVRISSTSFSSFSTVVGFGEYQLTIRPNGSVNRDVLMVDYHMDKGDTNVVRQQGQFIIESNIITNFNTAGVSATFNGPPDDDQFFTTTSLDRRPGSAALLRNENTDRLLPGTVISNNVVVSNGATGIQFSGESLASGNAPAPVPFGRITNNTVVGAGSGTGINVGNAASPTVLNNIITGWASGLAVSADSSTTVEGGNAYKSNTSNANVALAASSIVLGANEPLFQNAAARLYIPANNSRVIDSSYATLPDRSTYLATVKNPVGLSPSPIVAPLYDAYGIPRFDDPTVATPSGVGENTAIDRGAVDRADFTQPTAVLVNPADYIAGQGVAVTLGDIDPDASFVRLPVGSDSVAYFEVQLLDPASSGPDPGTVTKESVIVTEDGVRLTPDVDYTFGYSANSRVIRLTPTTGLWRTDSVYEITLNNENRVRLEMPSGDQIQDGDRYLITDSAAVGGNQSTFEFDSGYVLQVPQTLGIQVSRANNGFVDGDTFTITAPSGVSRTFEINLSGAVNSGNVEINLKNAGTVQSVRDAILLALQSAAVSTALNLAPRSIDLDSLQIGSVAGHTITGNVRGMSFLNAVADGVDAGEQFSYQSGPDTILFEFTYGAAAPTDPTAVAIPISRTSTTDEIAVAIANAIKSQPLGLSGARSIGDGRVLIGGSTSDVLKLVGSQLQVIGTPGVTGALTLTVPSTATGNSLNGLTFSVTNGTQTVNFVYTTNPNLVTTSRRVVLGATDTSAQIATQTAAEINAGFAGALAPSAVGSVVRLGEQASIIAPGTAQVRASVNVRNSTLVLTGVSGGAIPVSFIPTSLFTPAAAAASLTTAISTSPLKATYSTPGGGTLLFGDTASVRFQRGSGAISNIGANLPAIADLAGNTIASNRDDGETRFTIIMPEVKFDFGDAPDSYRTLFASNGARHSVSSDASPRLGTVIDTEDDGQPSPGSSDDQLAAVNATSPNNAPLFTFTSPGLGTRNITINDITPTSGAKVRVTANGKTVTFEFVSTGIAPATGNVAVPFIPATSSTPGDTAETIATRLADAIKLELGNAGGSLVVSIDPLTPTVVSLQSLDDEDGLAIGTFNRIVGGVTTSYSVFLRDGAASPTTDPADVLGFLNPSDPLGTNLSLTITGAGLVDAWVDFDKNGVFDDNEQVLKNIPVVDGVNTLKVFTPSNATNGATWARFRLSTGGNLKPTGVAIGGEVEDYPVQIINVPLPTPADDTYTINEDTVLNTVANLALPSVIDNDTVPPETFLPVRFFIGDEPTNGTLEILDPTSGRFIYTPKSDFYGVDTFTYRLSSQANAGAGSSSGVTFATVTINVRPVNDAPSAVDKAFTTLEDTAIVVTAAQLLAGSIADAQPLYPPGAPSLPWDETNQVLRISSIQAGATVITASNAASGPFATPRGMVQPTFNAAGDLIDLTYTPSLDLNRNNVAGGGPILDSFLFTVQDDGVLLSVNPDGTPGAPLPGPFTRLTATATATIDVAPLNDNPTLTSDNVSVGIVGNTTSNTPWRTYFTAQNLPVPVPTEDTPLTIPGAYLLQNDISGRSTTLDENNFLNGNDGSVSLQSVSAVTPGLVVTLDSSGNIQLTPPDDIYGNVVFTYIAVDQGIDESVSGVRSPNPLTSVGTVTVVLQPVNDIPVGYDRNITYSESNAAGTGPAFTFNAARLVNGVAPETKAVAGDFDPTLPAPFNETEQKLRVVAFRTAAGTVDVTSLTGGTGTLTLASDAGGRFEFDFLNGAFTNGRFISAADYNQRVPFAPLEQLEFLIADDGRTTRPQGGGVVILPSQRAANFATLTITVTQTNDAPVFNSSALVNVLERDDNGDTAVANFATNITPGPTTALDELATQTVRFEVLTNVPGMNVPAGLMRQAPTIDPDGTLHVYPLPDAVGNAVYVFEAVDADANDPNFVERRTRATVTIAVRPVNDAPRVNTSIAGTSQSQSADEGWSVATDGTITYTMKEDNTGPLGVTSPYSIFVARDKTAVGYQRLGLIDVFNAGPANEENSTQGGSQVLRLLSFQATTALGGTIRAVAFDTNGDVTRLEYTPPLDYNIVQGGVDSFTYVVQDNNPTDGETYNLSTNSLVENRRTATGTAQFRLLPVNDKPQFDVPDAQVSVLEDAGPVVFEDFVTNIFAGRPGSAFDEIDLTNGQKVTFSVAAVSSISGLFTTPPTITPDGILTFTTAPDAFGTAVFEVRATDDGPDNAVRGDLVSSDSQLITINIRPVNDRPVLNTTTPLTFALNEDAMVLQTNGQVINRGILIPLRGTGGQSGLLDIFNVGPTTGPGSESANVTPGGNQTLSLTAPIPAGTVNGGTLTQERDSLGNLIGLRYTPRENFNGVDSFVYGVIDNGQSVDLNGNASDDPQEAFTTVTLQVVPRNDAPIFGGAVSVTVDEDAATTSVVGQTVIANWATNIQAGPAGADDENDPVTGQKVTFTVNPVAGNPTGLFTAPPTVSPDGTLTFRTVADANGSAVFTVVASDTGVSNPPLEFNTSVIRTFTITVRPVNDAPTFTPGGNVVVDEDSGQYASPSPWATNIIPGPADEVAAGQTVTFQVTIPDSGKSLFTQDGTPKIEVVTSTDNSGKTTISGFLRFTVAPNASGSVQVTVVAVDSVGASAAPVTFTITVNEVNDVPVANNDTFSGNEDTAVTLTSGQLLSNDTDADTQFNPNETLTIVGLPSSSLNGAAIRVLANGSIQYDPRGSLALQALAPGQTRADTFTYRVQDAAGRQSNLATVTVNVAGRNDAPVLLPDTPTLTPEGVTIIRPLLNDSDIDGTINPASLQITLQPSFGSLEVRTDGTLIYTPFSGFRGSDVIRYTVADNLGLRSEEQTITIDINQAPVAVNDNSGGFRDSSVDINVASNDSDPDGTLDLESIVITRAPVRGTAVPIGGGLVRYVPEAGYIGSDSFQYTIKDNAGRASNVATVSLQVVGSSLQNPQNFTDVNASGQTSPIDALLVINRISRARREGVTGPVVVLPTDKGPNYYDVDGNGLITPNDALRVINQIARDNRSRLTGSAEGELTATAAPQVAAATANVAATGQSVTANDLAVTDFATGTLVADFSVPADHAVNALAGTLETEKKTTADDLTAAIDAAWADAAKF